MKKLLKDYIKAIADTTMQGDAREESYYSALKALFSDFPLEKDRKTKVTVLPKQTEAGNPDFRIWDGEHFIVGYIEAKTPGTNLDQVETSEQLERYLTTFPNVILTDFYEFRLYRDGVEMHRARIGRHFTAKTLKSTPQLEDIDAFENLANQFFAFKLPKTFTAETLAIELAKRTRFLRDQVVTEELRESEQGKGAIYGFYKAFQKYLITSLTQEQFADLYSQTITYGLFAARTRATGDFNRKVAFEYIPHTIGILRDIFRYISLEELSDQMEVIVDDLTAVLNAADINSILDQYYKEGRGEDPIVHFYETFLNQYDPETRERRGVYYTPEPVVKYIVKSVHELLKSHFGLRDGLADPSVTVLDPAAGTLTFPAEAIKLAVGEYVEKYGEGGKQDFIRNQILKNFYALELMMAPYAIGHMKMSYLLESLGYHLQGDESFQLYLTNTLEMEDIDQIDIPGISSLSEESRLAGRVKREPILVIMGNPPYSGISTNKNDWTEKLLKEDLDGAQSYYTVDGKPLGEKKVWLQDDYVKFLRFAQWKIQKAGRGIVAMITNHAYLDNPTFRGMRQSLLKTFDEIYILDLHGNSMKKETAPDGGKDENVFDIRQGVAVGLFIKNKKLSPKTIKHIHLFGKRDEKYSWLIQNKFNVTDYSEIDAKHPFYFFIPRKTAKIEHYNKWSSINNIFPVNVTGIVTARDDLAINFNTKDLLRKVYLFHDRNLDDEFIEKTLNLSENYAWKIKEQRKEFFHCDNLEGFVKEILYRPFDLRYIFYQKNIVFRMREEVMRNMFQDNLGLITVRQVAEGIFNHCFITKDIVESRITISNKGIGYLFPLYIYNDDEKPNLFSAFSEEKEPNINSNIYSQLKSILGDIISPENIMYYVYAILFSQIYRDTYSAFLKIDYPRIPFTANPILFKKMVELGHRLGELHLLQSPELSRANVKFQGEGKDITVGKRYYDKETQRVYINKDYYFEGVEPQVWEYQIGGYQVMDKYLKDRKGRKMDDPRHYIHIATAIAKTIEIQEEIDAIYPEVEKDVIEF